MSERAAIAGGAALEHELDPALERDALKEWAVLCDALASGDIVAMVRKGGIREQRAGFAVRHDRFLLYPTYFHEKRSELAPRFHGGLARSDADAPPSGLIRISLVAEVVGLWAVSELERLRAVEHEQGLAWEAIESRFHYRNRPGVQVIAVRILKLPSPVELPEARRYQGCVSWVALDAPVRVADAVPVLPEPELAERVQTLSAALG